MTFNHINNKNVEIPLTLPKETLIILTLQCSNVEIKCDLQEDYNGTIYWFIGGLIYDPNLNYYPSTIKKNSYTLLVLNAHSCYHNTTFQCFYLTPSDQVLGTEIRLVVLKSKNLTHYYLVCYNLVQGTLSGLKYKSKTNILVSSIIKAGLHVTTALILNGYSRTFIYCCQNQGVSAEK